MHLHWQGRKVLLKDGSRGLLCLVQESLSTLSAMSLLLYFAISFGLFACTELFPPVDRILTVSVAYCFIFSAVFHDGDTCFFFSAIFGPNQQTTQSSYFLCYGLRDLLLHCLSFGSIHAHNVYRTPDEVSPASCCRNFLRCTIIANTVSAPKLITMYTRHNINSSWFCWVLLGGEERHYRNIHLLKVTISVLLLTDCKTHPAVRCHSCP